ncbi:3-oxoacyl-(acyl-carrier-protein) reductase [Candidatus Terasakiella magnetica]|uniref:3-oxoacyl-(Acyl-carrier-protein) reductase n=1 Tax=Candidatus Terasakiella magnetica TaxID=1867952 RepID=A0A1C3RM08_9PROT|nr:SDR family oxidoreductase [Candidatus Terasakiella magnetica]SCA58324.1 3-oxoacyl-(acyl-carrier-protein) reductase [Candidatus Terasakiella magnetica]
MKVALITGAAHRIGAHIAKEMAAQGWAVAIHYHGSSDHAQEVCDEIIACGGKAVLFATDFACEEETQSLIGQVIAKMGRLDCLINNASTFKNDTALNATRESWDFHMEVNLRAPFVLSQTFVKEREFGAAGNIINIIDQRVWNLSPHFASYTISKAGLWAMTQTLSQAFAPHVRVNAIGPGPTLPSVRQSEADFQAQFEAVPLKKPTDLLDISNTVLYILGAHSMTGQMIALDGGEHLGWAQGDNHTPPNE